MIEIIANAIGYNNDVLKLHTCFVIVNIFKVHVIIQVHYISIYEIVCLSFIQVLL